MDFREKQTDEFEATMIMIYADNYLMMHDENEKMKIWMKNVK